MARGQHVAAQIGDAVVDGAAHLGRQRQHGAQHLAQRRQVVLRSPLGQLQQVLAEQRLLVEHGFEIPHLEIRRSLGRERRHHADELLVAEGHDDTRPALRRLPQAHAVGKRVVQRHRQRDFAERGMGDKIQCRGWGAGPRLAPDPGQAPAPAAKEGSGSV